MVKIRILITVYYKGSWPYIPEMIDAFNQRGIICDVYDPIECKYIYNNLRSEKYLINKKILSIILKFPRIGSYLRRNLNKRFFELYRMKYDILTVHNIRLLYYDIIDSMKLFANKSVGVAWGSDIYRIRDCDYVNIFHIINSMDYLIATKPMIDFLENKFLHKKLEVKTKQLFIVSKSIDNLSILMDQETKDFSKKHLDIPSNTLVITFGYNASASHQHDLFINALRIIKNELPHNIYILLPMTYQNDDHNYINRLDNDLRTLGLNYKIFRKFLNDKDVLRIRRVSDITINMQATDALSSSIREHLFARNIVIAGNWLPYDIFTEMGIFYLKTKVTDLAVTIADCINHYDEYKLKTEKNRDLIYDNFSFDKNIDEWINFYKIIL